MFVVPLGKEEVYPGWAKVTADMRSTLVKVGQIPNWEGTEDNQELSNAFLDVFGDTHFRNKLRNLGKAQGCASNAFRLTLWQVGSF